jgi:hypothetical protein
MVTSKYLAFILVVAIITLAACTSLAQNNSIAASENDIRKEPEVKSLNELESAIRQEIQSIDRTAYCLEEIDPTDEFVIYRSADPIQLTIYQCRDQNCDHTYKKFIEMRWINDSYELLEETDTYFFKTGEHRGGSIVEKSLIVSYSPGRSPSNTI